MTDRPMLFSSPMVRALLDGRKTQTRRVLKPQPDFVYDKLDSLVNVNRLAAQASPPRYSPGDRLYVRETWSIPDAYLDGRIPELVTYKATPWSIPGAWRPSIHMPRWASRITLLVDDVRVQRVQDISEEDLTYEGLSYCEECGDTGWINSGPDGGYQCTAPGCGDSWREEFEALWDSLNAKRGYGWRENPWIVALTFRVIPENIDRLDISA